MKECTFSMAHYSYILQRALELNYQISPMSAVTSPTLGPRSILLRHDVDVSLELAVQMAEFERDCGIRATYFVRLHANYYNLEDPQDREVFETLRKITEVGLHYEPSYYQMVGGDHLALLKRDVRRMANLLGTTNFGGCAHMPGSFGHLSNNEARSTGLTYEAYATHFVQSRKYLSDSAARWREGCICQWLDKEDNFTVLMHPVWWLTWSEPSSKVIERLGLGD